MKAWSASAAISTACRTPPAGASFDVHVFADAIRIFEDGVLIAVHAPLEGRGEKRLDPAQS